MCNKALLSMMAVLSFIMADNVGMGNGFAEDWPTFMHDLHRSGVSSMPINVPLQRIWTHIPDHPPCPAWPEPAKQDFWNQVRELSPVVIYDRAFHVVSVGEAVFYASSADDQVYCLEAKTGNIRWRFFTEAPVRLAPSIADNRVYFSSDDGYAYCITAETGELVWKYSPAEFDRRLPGNGRIISYAPARTGLIVDAGVAYFFSGLFPPDQVYRCALDAKTGKPLFSNKTEGVSPQGYLLASSSRLFAPTGRTAPVMFDRASMDNLGALQGPGGAYAILLDEALVSGPGVRDVNQLYYTPQESRERLASFPGTRMLAADGMVYLQSPSEVSALERQRYVELSAEIARRNEAVKAIQKDIASLGLEDAEKMGRLGDKMAWLLQETAVLEVERAACYRWKKAAKDPFSMILVSDILFMGGQDRLYALRAADGEELWHFDVEGRIYGLAAANGRLYASSSNGMIYCFGEEADDVEPSVVQSHIEFSWPEDELTKHCNETATFVLNDSNIRKGYCLLIGDRKERLAYALAQQSELHIICMETNQDRAAQMRSTLVGSGFLGTRIAVHTVEEAPSLPYTAYMANLIVAENSASLDAEIWGSEEIIRLLRPYGGRAYLRIDPQNSPIKDSWVTDKGRDALSSVSIRQDWMVLERGAVPGAGEWTQLYADAEHTANSNDELRGPVAIQWFGEPGPREMVDRHHRPMSSLFKNGRLFITGDNKIITVDAYNGFPLWQLEVPDSRRIGSMKSSGHQVLTEEYLYVARADECWAVDVNSGRCSAVIKGPVEASDSLDWGYLNICENALIGTLQTQTANFEDMSKATVNLLEGDYRPVIISVSVFAADRTTGQLLWRYQNGKILNSMMMISGKHLYMVESRNESVLQNTSGRIKINEFLQNDAFLLALDARTGEKIWERPIGLPFEHIAYLNGRDGILLASGSYNKDEKLFYDLLTFDMASGDDKWRTTFRGLNIRGTDFSDLEGSHGEQWQHPVISENAIYARPYAFDLETGEQLDYIAYRGGHGCGGLTGSSYYLYGRGSVPRMYPMEEKSTEGIPLTEVSRPGCFLNIIPAGGIIMAPESSSGCTCAYPLQTSLALTPKEIAGGVKRSLL